MTSRARQSGGRPSREQAAQIEERILQVGEALFLAHGYGATSIEAVAQETGISKRTFYHRFPDKAALFAAVIHRMITRLRPKNTDQLFEGKTLEATLLQVARAILRAALAPEAVALHRMLLSEATRFPELASLLHNEGSRQEAVSRIGALLLREPGANNMPVAASVAAEQFMQMVISVPQRRAMGLGSAMKQAELDAWTSSAVTLFLHGCRKA